MKMEYKIENPINIKLSKTDNQIMQDMSTKKCDPLIPGAMIGGEHYGFIIICDANGTQKEIVHLTSSRICGANIEDGILKIYEEGKYHPWKFKLDGTLISSAMFNEHSRRDWEYLRDFFEGYTKEDMEKANQYIKH